MLRLRSRQVRASSADRRHEVRGGEESEDRSLLRYLVGFERCLQHLQQEGLERLPLSMAYLHALSRRRFVDDAHLLGRWHRRDSQNGF